MPPRFVAACSDAIADANRLPPGQHPAIATQAMEERAISLRCAAAREEERRRMAADLHDGPTQQLVNLVLRLDLAEQGLPPRPRRPAASWPTCASIPVTCFRTCAASCSSCGPPH